MAARDIIVIGASAGGLEAVRGLVRGLPSKFLFAAQSEEVERALWVALRALEERAELQRQMAQRSKELHQQRSTKQFQQQWQENLKHAKVIRQVLENL